MVQKYEMTYGFRKGNYTVGYFNHNLKSEYFIRVYTIAPYKKEKRRSAPSLCTRRQLQPAD